MSKRLQIAIESKHYPTAHGPLPVLGPCHFAVEAGQLGVLLGPSGCGKTTILRLLLGLDRDYEGELLCGGAPIIGPGSERGVVFQEPRLLPWMSVQKNVEFGLERGARRGAQGRQRARDAVSLVGLKGFENRWPRELSGGMAQRAALARALVNVPDVLLLDEPFGALDTQTRASMQDELLRVLRDRGTTALLVTHDIDEALYLADKIVIMSAHPGRVLTEQPIALPHPRHRSDPALQPLRSLLLEAIFAPQVLAPEAR